MKSDCTYVPQLIYSSRELNLISQFRFVHHKAHMDWPGIEYRPLHDPYLKDLYQGEATPDILTNLYKIQQISVYNVDSNIFSSTHIADTRVYVHTTRSLG